MSSILWSNPVNRSHPLNRGLVSWWLNTPHASGGTTFRDLAGQNHGTLTNMDPATDWVIGNRPGSWGALDFDGSNDYVNAGSHGSLDNLGPSTYSMWLKTISTAAHSILASKNGVGATQHYAVLIGGQLVIYHETSGTALDYKSSSGLIGTDQWYHCVGVIQSDLTANLYIDGAEVTYAAQTQGTGTLDADAANDQWLGDRETGSLPFVGQLDDIRIYNRALNASEVRQLYNLSRTGYGDLLNRRRLVFSVPAAGGGGGRIMGSLAGYGGLAGVGGLAGRHGGLAG